MNNRRSLENNDNIPLTLSYIIEYIERNAKIIGVDPMEELKLSEVDDVVTISPLRYGSTKELIELPKSLRTIFESDTFYRAGVISSVNVPINVDVSYISSILYLLVPGFKNMNEYGHVEFTESFIRKMYRESRDNFDKFDYSKLGWKPKEFFDNIKNFKMGRFLLRYVADFLFVNIFILDNENDNLMYIGDKVFNKYKKNLFLLKVKDDKFEPIFRRNIYLPISQRDIYYLNCDSHVIKKILNSIFLVERIDCDKDEKTSFIVGEENLSKYITESKNNDEDINNFDDNVSENNFGNDNIHLTDKENVYQSDSNGFESEKQCDIVKKNIGLTDSSDSDTSPKHGRDELIKYKFIQLIKIAKNYNIPTTYKKNEKSVRKTKEMLINDIDSFKH